MSLTSAELPPWFQDCIHQAHREIDNHPDGLLHRSVRTRIWICFYKNSLHAHFRRGMAYFLTGCSVVPRWIGDPHVPDEHRDLLVAGLEVCRSLLLDREISKGIQQSIAWRLEEEANKAFIAAQAGDDQLRCVDRRSLPLAVVAACVHHLPCLPLIDDLDSGVEDEEHLFPESLTCMHETSYPVQGQWEADAVSRYWRWWIDSVLVRTVRPIDEMLTQVRSTQFTREWLGGLAFDGNR